MTKYNNIFATITYPEEFKNQLNKVETGEYQATMKYNIMTINKTIDDEIIEYLYNEYKNSDISHLYIVSRVEFEKFLLKYLPIYMKEKEND